MSAGSYSLTEILQLMSMPMPIPMPGILGIPEELVLMPADAVEVEDIAMVIEAIGSIVNG